MLKAVATSAADATGVTAAAVLTANQFVVGSDGARGVKTADTTITNPVASAASASAVIYTGAIFTGGTGTTTFPHVFIQPTGATAATNWSTSGTAFGINLTAVGNFVDFKVAGTTQFRVAGSGGMLTLGSLTLGSNQSLSWTSRGIVVSPASGTIQLGDLDAAAPVAQALRVQSVVSGTADTAGQNATVRGSLSTGSGASGDIIFTVGGTGAASTTVNTAITALTIKGATTNNTNVGYPSVVLGTAALATTATDGFLYLASGAGTPTGTPTGFTGRVPIYIDTTNSQLWLYLGGAWKQPKTPAAAATVTWQ